MADVDKCGAVRASERSMHDTRDGVGEVIMRIGGVVDGILAATCGAPL